MSFPRLAFALLLVSLASSVGCSIYTYEDDEPMPCDIVESRTRLRNPFTGQCQPIRTPQCDGDDVAVQPLPPWGTCDTRCDSLGEAACSADPACHAVYVESCPTGMTCIASQRIYAGCWSVAPAPSAGICSSLDAQACASRADCVGVFGNEVGKPDPSLRWKFTACDPERVSDPDVCNSNAQCDPGERCNLTDYCLPPPGCDVAGGACPPVCYGKCEPDRVSCDLVDCQRGYHCEVTCLPSPPIACTGPEGKPVPCPDVCKATCVPDDVGPGKCRAPVACDALPPACPRGTLPGIANGCWTGYCIPLRACEP